MIGALFKRIISINHVLSLTHVYVSHVDVFRGRLIYAYAVNLFR